MDRLFWTILATLFLIQADNALSAPERDDQTGRQACSALQRDTVAQSLRSIEFIDAHIESVSPQEQADLESESSILNLGASKDGRYQFVTQRQSYPAWRLHRSLHQLAQSLISIDEPATTELDGVHRVKSAAFALALLPDTSVAFAEYARKDKTRTAPILDDATRQVASVSLANIAPALAWFIGCNVDASRAQKK
ncbi:hypothetical protein LJR029_003992 [Caballeronia sp. LjRoot29]|uniref:hypothetical protein n=1 Tax=Caballeronia sp. LjRoot29 TaxID=3342315 RepID=UPI003ECFE2B8